MNFRSKVIKGRGVGKTLGFPTFNLKIPTNLQLEEGVYACKVDGMEGVLFYGKRKTFDNSKALEIHVLNEEVKQTPNEVCFLVMGKIREIKKFESEGELKKEIVKDCEKAKKILK